MHKPQASTVSTRHYRPHVDDEMRLSDDDAERRHLPRGHVAHASSHDDDVDGDDDDDEDDDDDDDDAELGEREPLVGSSAVSPSTGSSSLLRRNFRGPKAKRSCTDAWALAVFLAYWVGMLVVAIYAFTRESNVSYAKYIKDGVDYQGHACGDNRFVYFPDYRANPDFGFCVSSCPTRDGDDLEVMLPLADAKILDANGTRELTSVHFTTYATHPWSYVCAPATIQKESVMIAQLQDTIGRFVGALGDCWKTLLITCAVSVGTAALYLIFLKYCGCFTIFLTTVSIEALLVYASYRLLRAAADPLLYINDPAMKSSLQIAAVVVCCSAVLFLMLAFSMLPRLMLAATFISHASRALSQLRKLLFVPLLSSTMIILLFWWGLLVTVCIFGAGETSTRVATVTAASPAVIEIETEAFKVNSRLRWFFIYHAWGIYWTATFILSIGEMITATAVSMWYFSHEDRVTGQKLIRITREPVRIALRSTFRYHLGTLALSSAVVTPISYVRSFFDYLQDKNEFDSNPVTETLARFCCVSSPVLPLIAIIVFSYGVAHAFMTIYETTINMLLMCFTLDENMHGGRGNTAFAHATLVRSVNDHLRPKWQTVL
ncbi:hypothetical protein P43SY_000738 [Pythium insidiosum]|uniref:Choline transporter-like protein n=1 Tax=Pythium insidiosum TaxID=114742 RepID=A0AAD5M8X3_PYTIN|nr:hypothetical protein P43SY_000738 [Pythium insidiosum]KAJ0412122.1 hypothetical protein ATCC90586_004042 [Pythium insidiosum]